MLGCTENKIKNTIIKKDSTVTTKSETYQELGFFGSIKKDQWDQFTQAVQNNIANSRKEPGNISFSLYQPENGNLQPIWFERFDSKKAHDNHMQQDYFKNAIKVIQKSLEGEAQSIYLKEVDEIPATRPKLSDAPEKTHHVIVLFNILPEKKQPFINAMATVAPQSRKASGNLEFNVYQFADDPHQFVLVEGWESKSQHEAQLKQDYIKQLNTTTKDFFVTDPMNTRWLIKDISLKNTQ